MVCPLSLPLPHASRGMVWRWMPKSDPSIKAILVKLDRDNGHMYIIEDLDDSTLVVKEQKLSELKSKLGDTLRKTAMQEREDSSSSDGGGGDDEWCFFSYIFIYNYICLWTCLCIPLPPGYILLTWGNRLWNIIITLLHALIVNHSAGKAVQSDYHTVTGKRASTFPCPSEQRIKCQTNTSTYITDTAIRQYKLPISLPLYPFNHVLAIRNAEGIPDEMKRKGESKQYGTPS